MEHLGDDLLLGFCQFSQHYIHTFCPGQVTWVKEIDSVPNSAGGYTPQLVVCACLTTGYHHLLLNCLSQPLNLQQVELLHVHNKHL